MPFIVSTGDTSHSPQKNKNTATFLFTIAGSDVPVTTHIVRIERHKWCTHNFPMGN